jgi:hypothetical protein
MYLQDSTQFTLNFFYPFTDVSARKKYLGFSIFAVVVPDFYAWRDVDSAKERLDESTASRPVQGRKSLE